MNKKPTIKEILNCIQSNFFKSEEFSDFKQFFINECLLESYHFNIEDYIVEFKPDYIKSNLIDIDIKYFNLDLHFFGYGNIYLQLVGYRVNTDYDLDYGGYQIIWDTLEIIYPVEKTITIFETEV